ncbi:MAG: TlpA family protein disulfide reductase [Crocinitomicaceae bacterium]|jgi:thiol-disulfide isomerase/thioredoxin|nr:TlpA family protein disulfide reductase [Crocinitomicaceae bacterium]
MKRLLLISFFLNSLLGLSQEILIRVHSKDTGFFKLSYYPNTLDFIDEKLKGMDFKNEPNKTLEFHIPATKPIGLTLFHETTNVFWNLSAKAGDTVDVWQKKNQYVLSGKWKAEKKYDYSIPGYSLFHFLLHRKMYEYKPKRRIHYLQTRKKRQYRNLYKKKRKLKLTPEFVREKESEIAFEYLNDYFQLPYSQHDYSPYFTDSIIQALINSVDWEYAYNMNSMSGLYALSNIRSGIHYQRAKEVCPDMKNCSVYKTIYMYDDSIIRTFFPKSTQPTLHFMFMKGILDGLELSRGSSNFDSLYAVRTATILEHLPDLNNKVWEERILSNIQELKSQEKAFISAFDSSGVRVDLSAFEGKVVYIDFWARGCFPCIQEMPHSKKLQETFKEEEVVFLYIAFEKDWLVAHEFLTKKGIKGTFLILPDGFNDETAINYGIRSIPRYMLIDRNGNFISKDASLPSFEITREIIRNALDKDI